MSTEFRFKLEEKDLNAKVFKVEYNSVKDVYSVLGNTINGWRTATYRHKNIQHKVEQDWKKCYLARTKGADAAHMEWVFDLSNLTVVNKQISTIELKLVSDTFENGQVNWSVSWENKTDSFDETNSLILNKNVNVSQQAPFRVTRNNEWWKLDELKSDLYVFKVRADLFGGSGENAWQHTQLFRQNLTDDAVLFAVCFHIED